MSWPLRLIESPYANATLYVWKPGKTWQNDRPRVGDCFFAPELLVAASPASWMHLSPAYDRDWRGKRDPLVVMLPSGDFCVDAMAWKSGTPYGDGWTVKGTVPLITVTPSFHIVGSYHGYITNGVIGDDLDKRVYSFSE